MTDQALSPKQKIYCAARAEGLSVKDSTDRAGVTEDTGTRWNREPAIWAHIEELQNFTTSGALRILRAKAERAAERVTQLMEPGYQNGAAADTNLRAALATLKFIGAEPAEKREHSGPDGGAIKVNITNEFVDYGDPDDDAGSAP